MSKKKSDFMDYVRAQKILEEADLIIARRDLRYGFNKVRFHSKQETLEHMLTKTVLAFSIFKKGDASITELEIPSGETIDNVQIKNIGGEIIPYEIQSEEEKDKSYKHITINLKDMPKEVKEAIKIFRKWVESYMA